KRVKQSATISYDAKALRLARRRAKEKTEAFRETYRYRAGIEGTMSDLDRLTGIKRLRVRGMTHIRVAATLKATGLNILRSSTFRIRKRRRHAGKHIDESAVSTIIWSIKERFIRLLGHLRQPSEEICLRNYRLGAFNAPSA
ncbi:MAG: hypothetical protein EHM79_14720, partial [Geobacter sp.]